MYLLFEEHIYPTDWLNRLGLAAFIKEVKPGQAKCNHVGFHRDYHKDRSVFVLPKVFAIDGKLFGKYDYHCLCEKAASSVLTSPQYAQVRTLCEKIYFCLRRYQLEVTSSGIVEASRAQTIRSTVGAHHTTAFEAMLTLIAFARSNPHIYVQTKEFENYRGINNIDWKNTFSKSIPFQSRKGLLYLEPYSKRPPQSPDDFLLSVYYSLLRDFRAYDPTIPIDTSVHLFTEAEFCTLKPRLPNILRNCRFQYYSDKLRQLYAFLQSFFNASNAALSSGTVEYLFTDNFQAVFEKMVDVVLSDEDLLRQYKHLRDGKEIDHLFGHNDILKFSKIIFVGDSKYYKDPSAIAFQKYKQFTYARNIIQEHIYVINRGLETTYTRNFRDPLSEGYNITPNFFVYGTVSAGLGPEKTLLSRDADLREFSYHFANRLFDRDTLHILYFKIDFPLLLNCFIGALRRQAELWNVIRQNARDTILLEAQRYLDGLYGFYLLDLGQDFIRRHFKILHGKLFTSPVLFPRYILALEHRYEAENQEILAWLADQNIVAEQKHISELPQAI
jgi:hypothetical protein